MRVYLAGPFSWKDALKTYSLELNEMGIEVTSSWLDEEASPDSTLDQFSTEHNQKIANIDVADIERADVVAVFTINPLGPPKPRGGRHWETGYAQGRGKEVIIIGPKENIFHYLDNVKQFDGRLEAKQYLYRRSVN